MNELILAYEVKYHEHDYFGNYLEEKTRILPTPKEAADFIAFKRFRASRFAHHPLPTVQRVVIEDTMGDLESDIQKELEEIKAENLREEEALKKEIYE